MNSIPTLTERRESEHGAVDTYETDGRGVPSPGSSITSLPVLSKNVDEHNLKFGEKTSEFRHDGVMFLDDVDRKVEEILRNGREIPNGLKTEFCEIYKQIRDRAREGIRLRIERQTYSPTGDPERDGITNAMRDWVHLVTRQDEFSSYKQLMKLQGFEPVHKKTFRFSAPPRRNYRHSRYGRDGRRKSPNEIENDRNCIAERWRNHIQQRKLAIGDLVTWDKGEDEFYRIENISEDCRLVLVPVTDEDARIGEKKYAVNPNECRHPKRDKIDDLMVRFVMKEELIPVRKQSAFWAYYRENRLKIRKNLTLEAARMQNTGELLNNAIRDFLEDWESEHDE